MKSPFSPTARARSCASLCAVKTEIQDTLELHEGDIIAIDRNACGTFIIGAWTLRGDEFFFQPLAWRRRFYQALWLRHFLCRAISRGDKRFDARALSCREEGVQ